MNTSLTQGSLFRFWPSVRLALVAGALIMAQQAWAADNASGTSPKTPPVLSTVTVQIQHRTVDLPIDFEAFNRNLVGLLGHFDPNDVVIAATDLKKGLERLQASQGEQGLMLFDGSNVHGTLFPLVGKPARKAIRHHLGNPLIAVKMTQKNMSAALYAPLTILVYERTPGSIRIEYDLPSSTFGQFHDPEIDQVGTMLDTKLYTLLLKASGVSN